MKSSFLIILIALISIPNGYSLTKKRSSRFVKPNIRDIRKVPIRETIKPEKEEPAQEQPAQEEPVTLPQRRYVAFPHCDILSAGEEGSRMDSQMATRGNDSQDINNDDYCTKYTVTTSDEQSEVSCLGLQPNNAYSNPYPRLRVDAYYANYSTYDRFKDYCDAPHPSHMDTYDPGFICIDSPLEIEEGENGFLRAETIIQEGTDLCSYSKKIVSTVKVPDFPREFICLHGGTQFARNQRYQPLNPHHGIWFRDGYSCLYAPEVNDPAVVSIKPSCPESYSKVIKYNEDLCEKTIEDNQEAEPLCERYNQGEGALELEFSLSVDYWTNNGDNCIARYPGSTNNHNESPHCPADDGNGVWAISNDYNTNGNVGMQMCKRTVTTTISEKISDVAELTCPNGQEGVLIKDAKSYEDEYICQ